MGHKLSTLLTIFISMCSYAQTRSVTITEPGIYEIGDLFKTANVVALVRIVSGDAENYSCAIYKGEVMQSFKGSQKGMIVYFGPFTGRRLGEEYVLFLRNVDHPIEPTKAAASYGTVHYSRIFDEGYSSMETSYQCVFDGDEIAQKCDYGVRSAPTTSSCRSRCQPFLLKRTTLRSAAGGSERIRSFICWRT